MDINTTVGEIVRNNPGLAARFEELGVDFCCGGSRTLSQVCAAKGLNPEQLIQDLHSHLNSSVREGERVDDLSMKDLVQHILDVHHTYLRDNRERILRMTAKLAKVHGNNHPELIEIDRVFSDLMEELEGHMQKEEQIFFPAIAHLEMTHRLPQGFPSELRFLFGPMSCMEAEHEEAGAMLARIRDLSADYRVPDDGCNTYRSCMHELYAMEKDIHLHIHKENNILHQRLRQFLAEMEQ